MDGLVEARVVWRKRHGIRLPNIGVDQRGIWSRVHLVSKAATAEHRSARNRCKKSMLERIGSQRSVIREGSEMTKKRNRGAVVAWRDVDVAEPLAQKRALEMCKERERVVDAAGNWGTSSGGRMHRRVGRHNSVSAG